MSHPQQRQFLATAAEFFPEFFAGSRVLEIGSLDVNGSARSFFTNCEYTGLDVGPGPGVDIVCSGHQYDAPDGSFDIVLSMETMEHNPYWVETVRNMLRLCRRDGLVLVSCASLGRPEHGTTRTDRGSSPLTVGLGWDHYRNVSEAELRRTIESARQQILARYWTNWQSHDLYMAAINGTPSADVIQRFASMGRRIDMEVRRENGALRARVKRMVLGRRHGETLVTSVRRLRKMCRGT